MTLPADKPLGDSSGIRPLENRRASKPLMEKKRRARINKSLCELKTLILDTTAEEKQGPKHSKLEKADILEMTVRHLRSMQRQFEDCGQIDSAPPTSKFRQGFLECIKETCRFFKQDKNADHLPIKQPLVSHLERHFLSMGKREETVSAIVKPQVEDFESAGSIVQLTVGRLPNGQLALLMPENCRFPISGAPLDLSSRPVMPEVGHRRSTNEDVWRPW